MVLALAAKLIAALLLPCAVALKSSLAADWASEGLQPVNLERSNATGMQELKVDEDAVLKVAKDFFPRLNLSVNLITQTTPKTSIELNETCRMSREEKCEIASFKPKVPTMVYPGGATRCIFGDEFAFSVVPGVKDRLLIFFEGGGACWDEATSLYQTPTCKSTCSPTSLLGPYNTCPGDKNPFHMHTVLYIQSCSGDMHAGQRERIWRNPSKPGVPVVQRGYANVRAAIDWVKQNTARHLTNFALAGESSGAVGVQLWANALLAEFSYDKASVVADSDVGIFPKGFQGPMFKDIGACDTGLFNEEVNEWCRREDVSVEEVYGFAVRNFRNVVFAHLLSKHDAGQMLFYDIARNSLQLRRVQRFCNKQGVPFGTKCDLSGAPTELSLAPKLMESSDFHRKIQVVVDRHSMEANYISYLMTGSMHPIFPFVWGKCKNIDYERAHIGGFLAGADGRPRYSVQEWLEVVMLAPPGSPMKSRCEELSLDEDDYCRDFQKDKKAKTSRLRTSG